MGLNRGGNLVGVAALGSSVPERGDISIPSARTWIMIWGSVLVVLLGFILWGGEVTSREVLLLLVLAVWVAIWGVFWRRSRIKRAERVLGIVEDGLWQVQRNGDLSRGILRAFRRQMEAAGWKSAFLQREFSVLYYGEPDSPGPIFAIHGGEVLQEDGTRGKMEASEVVFAYRLLGYPYVIWDERSSQTSDGRDWKEFVHLWPRDDGEYTLPLVEVDTRETR